MKPTKEQFYAYERLRYRGTINMLEIERGMDLTGLDRQTYIECIEQYSSLKEEYGVPEECRW